MSGYYKHVRSQRLAAVYNTDQWVGLSLVLLFGQHCAGCATIVAQLQLLAYSLIKTGPQCLRLCVQLSGCLQLVTNEIHSPEVNVNVEAF